MGSAPLAFAARPAKRAAPAKRVGPVAVETNERTIEVVGDDFALVVDRDAAAIASFAWRDFAILERGPVATLWRAPTDNDGLRIGWMRDVQGVLREWLRLGLDRLERRAVRATARPQRDGSIRVRLDAELIGADPDARVRHRQEIDVRPDGTLHFAETIDVPKAWRDVPRVGVVLALPRAFAQLEWLGLGPHETYADRRASGRFGRFASRVVEQYVPYAMPQEHGHHVETRWLRLATDDGVSVRVAASRPFGFSASRFRAEDLFGALHTSDLVARDETVLHLDAAHRGLGTGSCGPDVLPRHRVGGGRYRFAWSLAVAAGRGSRGA